MNQTEIWDHDRATQIHQIHFTLEGPIGFGFLKPFCKTVLKDRIEDFASGVMAFEWRARVQGEVRLGRLGLIRELHSRVNQRVQTPLAGVQHRGQKLGELNPVPHRGFEQAGRTIQKDAVPGIDIAGDSVHQAKEFQIAKQQLVLAGIVAVRGDHQLARAIQNALGLREVIALEQPLRLDGFKGDELVLFQIGVQAGLKFRARDRTLEFDGQIQREVIKQVRARLEVGSHAGGSGKNTITQEFRFEDALGLKLATFAVQKMREATPDAVIGAFALIGPQCLVQFATPASIVGFEQLNHGVRPLEVRFTKTQGSRDDHARLDSVNQKFGSQHLRDRQRGQNWLEFVMIRLPVCFISRTAFGQGATNDLEF